MILYFAILFLCCIEEKLRGRNICVKARGTNMATDNALCKEEVEEVRRG